MPTPCFRSLRIADKRFASEAGVNTLADYLALKLTEHAKHLKHYFASGCAGVDRLLVQIQVHAFGFELAMTARKSGSDRPRRSTDQAITLSKSRRVTPSMRIFTGTFGFQPSPIEGGRKAPGFLFLRHHIRSCRSANRHQCNRHPEQLVAQKW